MEGVLWEVLDSIAMTPLCLPRCFYSMRILMIITMKYKNVDVVPILKVRILHL